MDKDTFIIELRKLNIILTDKQLKQLDRYYELLREWNEKINLTRIIEEKEVYLKHFYDSLSLVRVVDLNNQLSLCDIGTGAGFPGMVLKIIFPTLQVVLVDSLLKRINFLNLVIKELGLNNIQTVHSRAEDYARYHREEFDIVTSRAMANLSILLEISIPMVKVNKYFIAMKANCEEELKEAQYLLEKLDTEIECIDEFNLPMENSHRTIIKFIKKGKTNCKYPRSFDKIKKNH